ncbi:MAG: hypothetical protein KIS96_11905 [Bauldia sp.]|nr:hypothetical protein [Bauldia sp.]
MRTVVIVGCGQMGSRLLQGLLAADAGTLDVTVVDPSGDSLRLAETRAGEVAGAERHRVRYQDAVMDLPAEIDLAILASTSRHRLEALRRLAAATRPRTVLFEKFLFDRREHYGEAEAVLAATGAHGIVHCPRPTWPDYRRLANGSPASVAVTGAGWAMASNAVHFFDLARFFNARPVTKVTVAPGASTGGNKRAGYREIFGTLRGEDDAGNSVVLSCDPGETPSLRVEVTTADGAALIDELAGTVSLSGSAPAGSTFNAVPASRNVALMEALLEGRPTGLPDYAQAALTHLALFDALLPLIGDDDGSLPVT